MKSSLITRVLTTTGFVLGAFALAAVAGTWTPAPANPPDNNVDAPINVGSMLQLKTGPLTVNHGNVDGVGLRMFGKILIDDGNQALGRVLTSDANGIGSWQEPTGGTGTSGSWGRIYTFSKYVPINTSTGVSSWINVSLPNGDKMTAAALRISGTTNTDNAYDRFAIDEFAENSSYVEVDIPGQRVRVHMLKRSSLVANTAYPYANETVYLTIYTGSPGGGVASYAPGMWCGSEVGSNFAGGMVGPTVQCQGFNPATSCPVGFTRVLTGQNSGSYTCIKN